MPFTNYELIIFNIFLSSIVSLIVIPLIKNFSLYSGIVAKPDFRSQHKIPIVRLGGLAIYISFLITLSINYLLSNLVTFDLNQINFLITFLLGSCIFFILGLIDDFKNLSPFLKLVIQILASGLVWKLGIRIDFINIIIFQNIEIPALLSFFLTIFWIVAITNAINWIDGLDGLAAGIMLILITGVILGSIIFNQPSITLLASAIAGCCISFLKYNFYPAKIIMGDGGSYFFGFTLATLSINAFKEINQPIFFNLSLLIVAIPILDMFFVILRRIYAKKSPFYPDRIHLHHRLLNAGLSYRKTVYLIYLFFITKISLMKFLLP